MTVAAMQMTSLDAIHSGHQDRRTLPGLAYGVPGDRTARPAPLPLIARPIQVIIGQTPDVAGRATRGVRGHIEGRPSTTQP